MKNPVNGPGIVEKVHDQLAALRRGGQLVLQAGDQGYASAPSNIALLKYWGKQKDLEQIPLNSSLSFTLGHLRTWSHVTVTQGFMPLAAGVGAGRNETLGFPAKPQTTHLSENASAIGVQHTWSFFNEAGQRVQHGPCPPKTARFLNRFLSSWGEDLVLHLSTRNGFPTACGVASSASGFAALVGALGHLLNVKERCQLSDSAYQNWLAQWARLGSGSALRSVALHPQCVPFVGWFLNPSESGGERSDIHLLEQVHPSFHDLKHVLVSIDESEKSIPSSQGHGAALSSVLHPIRLAGTKRAYADLCKALVQGDWHTVQTISETDALAMHAVMLTGSPPACYLNNVTANLISEFVTLRDASRSQALWSLDAGPNIHILYHDSAQGFIEALLAQWAQRSQAQGNPLRFLRGQGSEGLHVAHGQALEWGRALFS